jgi:hypothetical protein
MYGRIEMKKLIDIIEDWGYFICTPVLTLLMPLAYLLIIIACIKFLCGCSFMGGMEVPSGTH